MIFRVTKRFYDIHQSVLRVIIVVLLEENNMAFEKLKNITLPLIVPSMTVVVTLSIAGGLKVFDIIYVITNGGPGFDTQVLATYTYQSFSLGFLGESSAGSIILAIIVVIISFTMNHYLTKREVEM